MNQKIYSTVLLRIFFFTLRVYYSIFFHYILFSKEIVFHNITGRVIKINSFIFVTNELRIWKASFASVMETIKYKVFSFI